MSVHKFGTTENSLITFVNTFQVHGSLKEFEEAFAQIANFMANQPGFVQYTLSRHVDDDKQDRYVNVALWRDVESWKQAVAHQDFQPHAKEIRARSTNEGNLYAARQFFSVE